MNRPFTGAMQFDGELEAGLYLSADDSREWQQVITAAEDQLSEMKDFATDRESRNDITNVEKTLSALRGLLNRPGIPSPQRARLEE